MDPENFKEKRWLIQYRDIVRHGEVEVRLIQVSVSASREQSAGPRGHR
jgi:hypothetical protein